MDERYFGKAKYYEGDCYVADYTDKTSSERGVEISEQPFEDISYFHLKKANISHIRYIGVNFEEHPSFIKGIQNCECMFVSCMDVSKPWLMMLEMKYCEGENIEGYAYKAFSQMRDTLAKVEREGVLSEEEGIQLIGNNRMLIATSQYLFEVR